jgi:hypothetical protein
VYFVTKYCVRQAFRLVLMNEEGPHRTINNESANYSTVRSVPKHTQPPVRLVLDISPRLNGRGVVLNTHPLIAPLWHVIWEDILKQKIRQQGVFATENILGM